MPTSGWQKIGHVMQVLNFVIQPASVLDVGIGFGKFGFLFRETLDIRKRRYDPSEWQTRIDGVESWRNYITPVQQFIYDNLYIGDIRKLVHQLDAYELIVLADVIEHMPFEEGASLLRVLFSQHCTRGMVVSYPNTIGSDWKRWENPYERHQCIWKQNHILELFPDAIVKFSTSQVAFILKEN